MLSWASHELARASPDQVAKAIRRIVGAYPAGKPSDPDTYLETLTEIMAGHPGKYVEEVGRELPLSLKFMPAPAEVKEALQAKANKRKAIACRAQWLLDDLNRRGKEARREAEREEALKAMTPERRQQIAVGLALITSRIA